MQLPELPGNMRWKVCVNTFAEYEDGKDMGQMTEFRDKVNLMIPPRTVVVLEAESIEPES